MKIIFVELPIRPLICLSPRRRKKAFTSKCRFCVDNCDWIQDIAYPPVTFVRTSLSTTLFWAEGYQKQWNTIGIDRAFKTDWYCCSQSKYNILSTRKSENRLFSAHSSLLRLSIVMLISQKHRGTIGDSSPGLNLSWLIRMLIERMNKLHLKWSTAQTNSQRKCSSHPTKGWKINLQEHSILKAVLSGTSTALVRQDAGIIRFKALRDSSAGYLQRPR